MNVKHIQGNVSIIIGIYKEFGVSARELSIISGKNPNYLSNFVKSTREDIGMSRLIGIAGMLGIYWFRLTDKADPSEISDCVSIIRDRAEQIKKQRGQE